MHKHVVVATRRLPPCNVGLPLPGMPPAPRGARMAAVCPTWYADDTRAITLAPAAAPMAEAQGVTDRTAMWMADTGQSGNAAKSTSWLRRAGPRRYIGHWAQATSVTPSWPWTLSPTATGRSRLGRAIATPGNCCR